MTTFMTHRNHQSYNAGRFVREARAKLPLTPKPPRRTERLVLAMVLGLTGMACWSAADTLPLAVMAEAPTARSLA